MSQLFAFLFKYRPAAFAAGSLAFDTPAWWWAAVLAALAVAVHAAVAYSRAAGLHRRHRLALGALRLAALALLTACLAGPVLEVVTAAPQRNAVAVLIDDSRSMAIADAPGGRSRFEAALAQFGPATGPLAARLAERFEVRVYTFSEALRALAPEPAPPSGRLTDLAGALDEARERLADGRPLAGVVVVSDGGENAGGALTETLLRFRAAGIPVHSVGAGTDRFDRDVSVEAGAMPEHALRHSSVVLEVRVSHRGFAGTTVPVLVEDEGAVVGRTEVRLPRSGEAVSVPVSFTATSPGPRRLRILVPVRDGEQVAENNVYEALLPVEDRRERILYFEGEPRYELKFMRSAVEGDAQLRLVTLLRSARDKFLRLDVEDSTELLAGFPRTREELFAYRGLVLGAIEAGAFTRDQLRMLAEFVRVRGGGLLVLGGRGAFTAGGWALTPLAEALPVELPEEADTAWYGEIRVSPTPAGRRHPTTRLAAAEAEDRARWDSLPPLTTAHRLRTAKPGAAVLLEGGSEGRPLVVLATHRYGRGRAAVLNVLDLWQWQMHASIPVDDATHETFVRQLLRWLVADTPEPVAARTTTARVLPGRGAEITADVTDSAYAALNGATVSARVRGPDGSEETFPMEWSVREDGEYRGRFAPHADGLHEVTIEARSGERLLGSSRAWVEAGDPRLEFARAERQSALLERLAEETGGRHYDLERAGALPEEIAYTEAGATVVERLDLWDMPAVLLLFLALVGSEWTLRRARGLA